ncbi:hypothetical protein BKA61DRAFT_583096 [Leptodontidium sp. MPI-SDFR-AT-0119]|nr:hypothetical protein BKA61DRAFT_583096 [Leptodontidium sp. MPI-SDFR-AT-0119]
MGDQLTDYQELPSSSKMLPHIADDVSKYMLAAGIDRYGPKFRLTAFFCRKSLCGQNKAVSLNFGPGHLGVAHCCEHTTPSPPSFLLLFASTSTLTSPPSTIMEDFNLPSTERTNLLKDLQEAMSDTPVPPYFWAMCQITRISPPIVRSFTAQAYSMVLYWTQSAQGTSRGSTPNTTQINRGLGSSPTGSPPAKRQKTTESLLLMS